MSDSSLQLELFPLKHKNDNPKHRKSDTSAPETYKGIYAMHKYWSKKPHNLVANYIERFSVPGDTILDSFCGSGITLIKGVHLKRKAVGIDINPIAIFITKMGLTSVDIEALQHNFEILKREVAPVIDGLYYTNCPQCKEVTAVATHTIWEAERPKEVWYACSHCKIRKGIKMADESDLHAASKPTEPPRWYPTDLLIENSRINVNQGMRISGLFTPRSLVSLSLLFEKICQIKDEKVRDVMKFCFSGALPQASNMVFVVRNRGKTKGQKSNGKATVGSWVIGYWLPSEHFEIHVWRCFENRFRRIVKGKQEVNLMTSFSATKCSHFQELNQAKEGYMVEVGSATDLPLPPESIDYVFIDPPHGNRIPYLELSLMWNAWLGFHTDFENEIVISQAKQRQKDITDYRERLTVAFRELWRVLKPNKYASVVFNSLDDEEWLSLLKTCLGAGFKVIEIQPLAYSARSVVQDSRKNGLKTDLVITYKKTFPKQVREISFHNENPKLEYKISEYLSKCSDGAETYQVLNHLLTDSIPTGKIFKISQILERLEKEFHFANGRWQSK